MIPLIDTLTEACRMLPEVFQGILFFGIMLCGQLFFIVGFIGLKYLLTTIIIFQCIIILVLIQKNIVYRNLSKIEKAVKIGLLWIKTRREAKKINRYKIMSFLAFSLTLFLYSTSSNIKLLIINLLICIFYLFKNIFYVPVNRIRIIKGEQILFLNEYKEEILECNLYKTTQLVILDRKILLRHFDGEDEFDID